jgi:hypothetical protein
LSNFIFRRTLLRQKKSNLVSFNCKLKIFQDQAIISTLLNELIQKVEENCNQENGVDSSSESVDSSNSSSDDSSSAESNKITETVSKPVAHGMSSFSLSAFTDKMRESELEEAKLAEEAAKVAAKKASIPIVPSKPVDASQFYSEFKDVPYGAIISYCLDAMVECVTRFPQCFKAYFRLAYTHKTCGKNLLKAKEFLIGPGTKRVPGLYGERKPNNFFHVS